MENTNVFDVDIANFESQVLEKSKSVLVLLDFWADWCGPCKQLTPILTKVVESYPDNVVLAKCNADEQQELAQHLNIRSLPTVMAVKDGQIVDGFMGALPESQVREFITKHLPDDLPAENEPEQDFGSMDLDQAIAEIDAAIANSPEQYELHLEKLSLLIRSGDPTGASEWADGLTEITEIDQQKLENYKMRITLLEIAQSANQEQIAQNLQANPSDWDSIAKLGAFHTARHEFDQALSVFLSLVKGNRSFDDDFGRKAMLALFDTVEDASLVREYRRQLASALF